MKTLAEHQSRILSDMADHPCWAIFAEAGTGKTMIALTWIYESIIAGRIDSALVICPASLVASWDVAISRMSEFGYSEDEIDVVRETVTVTSYSRVWVRNRQFARKKGTHKYEIRDELNHPWGVIFCDESHRLGDPSSVQTKTVLRMAGLSDHRYIMTGTPDSGKYTKLYGQLKFIEPALFGDYRDFDRRYVITKDFFKNPVKWDSDALEGLKRTHGSVARLRDCFDMPSETETDIPVPFTAENRKVYDALLRMRDGYGITYRTAGVSSMKAKQCCSGFYYDDDHVAHPVPNGKLDALDEIVSGREGKVVVFCLYIPSMDTVCGFLGKRKIPYLRFDSSVKEPVWKDFQSDDSKVIVIQYQRGSEGIDLFAADCMVFYEPTPSAHNHEQAKARIMRKGQMRPCSYYYLYVPGTLEERSMRSVRNGVDVSRRMLDEWAEQERANRT